MSKEHCEHCGSFYDTQSKEYKEVVYNKQMDIRLDISAINSLLDRYCIKLHDLFSFNEFTSDIIDINYHNAVIAELVTDILELQKRINTELHNFYSNHGFKFADKRLKPFCVDIECTFNQFIHLENIPSDDDYSSYPTYESSANDKKVDFLGYTDEEIVDMAHNNPEAHKKWGDMKMEFEQNYDRKWKKLTENE